ncbi:hypothetical protein V1520DRAFT_345139 [Lipomyces starkeyi]|uniref:Glycosyl transferase family 25 domain-containing protein n=1 Tax=Lipomyces starkeyi NRRL Y-11557 TaxID=675824 RepID=A0A1E3PZZ6_LIPST|nr:hypothetical protein LIPSTDRAFT_5070 [Lipomyces starkeyi NRRL Y-11557]
MTARILSKAAAQFALGATGLLALILSMIIGLNIYYGPFMPIRSALIPTFVADSVDLKSATHQAALATHAHNTSLGFGEIVYISMPDRTDRQDAMNLLAYTFGLKLKFLPGVSGADISTKAIPDEVPKRLRLSELGCWRAHANAWRYLLDSNMDTLLVLEDDIDWNPNVKQTFETLSLQMQNSTVRLNEPSDYERANAPYGLDWDILYLGSCKHGGNPDFKNLVQVWDDPDVPDVNHLTKTTIEALKSFGLANVEIGKKRVLAPAYRTECNTAYAITRQGAQRLLFTMSYIGLHGAVDEDMTRLFREGRLKGYTITPPVFSQFRVGGAKDTDNKLPGDPRLGDSINGKGNLRGWNYDIKGSARQSMADTLEVNVWDDYKRVRPETFVGAKESR